MGSRPAPIINKKREAKCLPFLIGAARQSKSEPFSLVAACTSEKVIVLVPSLKLKVSSSLSSYKNTALTKVSTSICRWASLVTSSLRNLCSQNVINSAEILGFSSFSSSMRISISSLAASSWASLVCRALEDIPPMMAVIILSMAVSVSLSCFSKMGKSVDSSSWSRISIDTIASIISSSISMAMVSLTTRSSITSFLMGFFLQSFSFFLEAWHL